MSTRAFDYQLKPHLAERAAIGLLALSTDATIEAEWHDLLSLDGVEFYTGRVPCDTTINAETLAAMAERLSHAAHDLLPGSHLDVLAYACTSASLVIGEAAVAATLRTVRPGIAVTTPLTAAKAALTALGANRIALLTPYIDEINQQMRAHFIEHGVAVPVMGSFLNSHDPEVMRIDEASIAHAARELAASDSVDAVFIACTALRGAELVPELEAELGIPVTTSNHAMAWHALRLAGVESGFSAGGRLSSSAYAGMAAGI